MRYVKGIVGLVLIAAAVAGIWFWETRGREELLYVEALVAARNISKGEMLSSEDLAVGRFESEALVDGSLKPKDAALVIGKEAAGYIAKNAQLTELAVDEPKSGPKDGRSIFKLKHSWLDNRSSSLRKGDTVHIYTGDGNEDLGIYELAYVKTEDEQEVLSVDTGLRINDSDALKRSFSEGVISHVEILCTLDEYKLIKEAAERPKEETDEGYREAELLGLLIVQEEV